VLGAILKSVPARTKQPNAKPSADAQLFERITMQQTQLVSASAALQLNIHIHGCKILLAGCFAAGTKLLTREGWRAVETLREGDELASRAEHDPYGAVAF
jgi:hypothetical protein